jgi:hypothetical protein
VELERRLDDALPRLRGGGGPAGHVGPDGAHMIWMLTLADSTTSSWT